MAGRYAYVEAHITHLLGDVIVMTVLAVLATLALTFWLGYHIGHQIGMTEDIRRHLREIRTRRSKPDAGGLGEHSGFSGH